MQRMRSVVTSSTTATYPTLKRRLRSTTARIGSAFTAYYAFMSPQAGVSAAVGTLASLVYMQSLIKTVDSVEDPSHVQKQLFVPIATALVENFWNAHVPDFQLNYGVTTVCFLSYQLALMTLLYDVVRHMLLDGTDQGSDGELGQDVHQDQPEV